MPQPKPIGSQIAFDEDEVAEMISEIGEYSEGLAPNDLRGAVEWLIAEETKTRIERDRLQREVKELEDELIRSVPMEQA